MKLKGRNNRERFSTKIFAPLLCLFFAACDGNGGISGEGDCPPEIEEKERERYLFALTTDYQSGSFSVVDTKKKRVWKNIGRVFNDAVARYNSGLIYIINRYGEDNIEVRDPNRCFEILAQYSTGAGSNPQDICFAADGKAFIPLYNETYLLSINPLDGEEFQRIDLSPFADDDGLPEMSSCAFFGDKIIVALQRLDRNTALWQPSGKSLLAVIESESGSVERTIELSATNPYPSLKVGKLAGDGETLWIGLAGMIPGGDDGGLERLEESATAPSGLLITEEQLGGDIQGFEILNSDEGIAAVSDGEFNMRVVRFKISTSEVETLFSTEGYYIGGIALSGDGGLYVSDRRLNAPGVRAFSAKSGEEMWGCALDVGVPPLELLLYPR
ncbi:MAG: hypothetical protein Kow0090_05760 [Myxococcota bacterium]